MPGTTRSSRELQTLEEAHPELADDGSPTQRVGAAPAPQFDEVTHPRPMLSLGNAFNEEEFAAWRRRAAGILEREEFAMVCEPKIDGLAIALTYEAGQLARAATARRRPAGRRRDAERPHDQVGAPRAAGGSPSP